jgi:hypothetical protein
MTEPLRIVTADEATADFSEERRRIWFTVDGDEFDCIQDIPVLTLIDFAMSAEKLDEAEIGQDMRDTFLAMFRMVLEEEETGSASRFLARMTDVKRPINYRQAMNVVQWAMAQYGMRPTEPSASSSPESSTPEDGPSLTANALQPGSTFGVSPFPGS